MAKREPIKPPYREIWRQLQAGEVVPFLGAGASLRKALNPGQEPSSGIPDHSDAVLYRECRRYGENASLSAEQALRYLEMPLENLPPLPEDAFGRQPEQPEHVAAPWVAIEANELSESQMEA